MSGQQGKRAFSLLETMVVVAVGLLFAMVAVPPLQSSFRDRAMLRLASELSSELLLARRAAQEEGAKIALLPGGDGENRMAIWQVYPDGSRRLSHRVPRVKDPNDRFGIKLPKSPLPHPTQSGEMDRALRSTHGEEIRFTERGSSSATVLFSDDEERAICAVISSQTGRFRVFVWERKAGKWAPFF